MNPKIDSCSIIELHHGDAALDGVKRIYMNSFPSNERRAFAVVRRYLKCSRRPFHILALIARGEVRAFLSYWDFGYFRYIEHLAVDAAYRGLGCGTKLMQHFLHSSSVPIVLEVEPRSDTQSILRVNFYEKFGFAAHRDFEYIQPPYSEGKDSVKLDLMTLGTVDEAMLAGMATVLHEQVYNVKSVVCGVN